MTESGSSSVPSTSTQPATPQFIQSSIPLPSKLDFKGNLAVNWKKFKRLWTNYEIASRLSTQSSNLRTATLLTCIGPDILEIYDGLPFGNEEEKTDIDKVIELLDAFFIGETNEIYEAYLFNQRVQEVGESFDVFLTALRSLAKTCNFGIMQERMIRDRVVVGIRDNATRKKLLAENKLTLNKCIDICRASETTSKQLKEMSHAEEVSAVATGHPKSKIGLRHNKVRNFSKVQRPVHNKVTEPVRCKFCHRTHPLKKELCPAWQHKCDNCGRMNHFSVACRSQKAKKKQTKKSVHNVEQDVQEFNDEDSDDYLFSVESVSVLYAKNSPKKIYANMRLRDETVKFQLDCGATVNILPADIYQQVFNDPRMERLQPTQTTLVMFNKSELKPLGCTKVETFNPKNGQCFLTEYTVVPTGHTALLGAESVQQFGLIVINTDNIMSLSNEIPTQPDLVSKFGDVFSGEGKLKGKLHLEIDKSVTPVALPVRKVPFAVKEPLKQELERLVKIGILQPVDVPTDWISSMVVIKKSNGKIRLCIDPKPLNKALRRNHFPLPVIDDLLPLLTNAKVFSVVDAKNGFWHVQLDDESSLLTTFGTPWGRFRWTRMPFGISPAPEEFQRRLEYALEGLDGIKPIFDDILVFGVGETETEALSDHDAKLTALLERCRATGIKLNKEKLKLRRKEVKFMGHVICQDGLKPDPDKVQGIKEMPTPTSKQDLKRLLGMVNYLQKFAPNLSEVTSPMRDLLKEGNQFRWDEQVQGCSFKRVKEILSAAPVLKYFNPKDDVELQCDASDRGLGACLMQGGQPVAYVSRSMTETEVNYAQIEKEMLAILFGVERFEQFVYGRPVKIQTDHKPLESIFRKSLLSAPKRLQRMLLRLQKFDLQVSYKKGTEMYLADTLSRAYRVRKSTKEDVAEDVMYIEDMRGDTERELEHINMIQYLPVSEPTLIAIQQATESDPTLRELKRTIRQGWPATKAGVSANISGYFTFRDELSLQNGLVFKGERLVIPMSVKADMLAKIHRSHIGIQGCLRRAREVAYWPGMNKDVEDYVAKCAVCNSQPVEQGKEPMICHELPSRPWEKIAVDLFDLNGVDFMVTVDYYSSFFEVDRMTSKTADEVVKKLKAHLARHGIPDQLVSDNGQPFSSAKFQQFADTYGFEHITSSPTYPQSNGKVENTVKTAKHLLEKAVKSEQDPYLALLDWRNTPTETLNSSPVQRLFGRRTKTPLPTSNQLLKPKLPEEVDQKLKLQKAKQSLYYNQGAKELKELRPGDTVRLQPLKSHLGKKKDWTQARVEGKVDIRSYQVRTEDGRIYRRNRRHLRHTREVMPHSEDGMRLSPKATPISATANSGNEIPSVPPSIPSTAVSKDQSDTVPLQNTDKPHPEYPPQSAADKQEISPSVTTTRSGRIVRPPTRYQ